MGHAAINAVDIDASLDFYTRVLGLPEAFRINNDDGNLWLVYLKTGDDDFLEIFAGGSSAPERGNNDAGLKHICLWVDDLQATLEGLRKQGYAVDPQGIKTGRSGCRQYFVADPDGVKIELMQLLPDSMQAKAMGDSGR
jgi:lactoylglutathione lyase